MSKKYLLGIDNGGTVSKAALFDLCGNQVMKKSVQIPIISHQDGFTERNLSQVKKANFDLIRDICEECDGEIVSVGLTGHGKGLYVLGDGGEFIYNGIGSTDRRAIEYEVRWNSDDTARRIYGKTAQKVVGCQPVALLRWLKDNERDTYDKIRCVLSCKDMIRYFLTGETFAEYTDVSGTNLLNLNTREYDMDLLREFGIEEIYDCLPPVKSSGDICGYISEECAEYTGLKKGTPVSGGMFDIDACAVAMGNILPGDLCMIAGTWSINEYVSEKPVCDRTVSMNSVFCDPSYYLCEESSACSCGNLEWLRSLIKEDGYRELDEAVTGLSPAACSVYYLPFLYASNENPYAKASFIGLDGSHGTAHVARAVYEGVAFSHKTHLNALLKSRGVPEKIRLAGGVVNSAVWTQMFADVMGIPMEIVKDAELGCKGAAMSAGIAAGVYSDYKDAVSKCVTVTGKILPDAESTEIYERKYNTYRKIITALDGVWEELRK
ncbi:MAG: carbohydrate kinase [Clostridia bacterium]|nr:carbohydrate kinase [Clostridia bacterium]